MRTSSLAAERVVHVRRAHFWAPLALFCLGLLTRLPLQSRMLYHWDSVNFALALERFDVADGRPHAPGYLLYVLLGRLALALTGDAQQGLTLLASLGSGLAAAALYDLGRRLWDSLTGWIAALLLLASPLFWFYGEVALPHTLDAVMVIVAAALSWRVWSGERRAAVALALWLGIAGGLRQQTLVFLFPLALVAGRRLPLRWAAGCLALLGLTTLAWLAPLMALSGGPARYLAMVASYSETFDRPTSIFLGAGWSGLRHNLDKLVRYTLWGWSFALPLVLLWPLVQRPRTWRLRDRRTALLALWAAPCLAFYTLIHMGQQGLIFVYLPILMLLSGRAAAVLSARRSWGAPAVALCVAAGAALYLVAPATLPGGLTVLSRATVQLRDERLESQISLARNLLPPGAALLSSEWRFAQYYLPDVPLVRYRHLDDGSLEADPLAADMHIAQAATTLAWFEPAVDRYNTLPGRTELLGAQGDVQLRIVRRAAGERFTLTASGFGVAPSSP